MIDHANPEVVCCCMLAAGLIISAKLGFQYHYSLCSDCITDMTCIVFCNKFEDDSVVFYVTLVKVLIRELNLKLTFNFFRECGYGIM